MSVLDGGCEGGTGLENFVATLTRNCDPEEPQGQLSYIVHKDGLAAGLLGAVTFEMLDHLAFGGIYFDSGLGRSFQFGGVGPLGSATHFDLEGNLTMYAGNQVITVPIDEEAFGFDIHPDAVPLCTAQIRILGQRAGLQTSHADSGPISITYAGDWYLEGSTASSIALTLDPLAGAVLVELSRELGGRRSGRDLLVAPLTPEGSFRLEIQDPDRAVFVDLQGQLLDERRIEGHLTWIDEAAPLPLREGPFRAGVVTP